MATYVVATSVCVTIGGKLTISGTPVREEGGVEADFSKVDLCETDWSITKDTPSLLWGDLLRRVKC